jgi:hypothetical protein
MKHNRRIPNKWLLDLQLDFVIGDPVVRHAAFDEEIIRRKSRTNERPRQKYFEMNRKKVLFRTPIVSVPSKELRRTFDRSTMYICEKPFLTSFSKPLDPFRCRSAEAEKPTPLPGSRLQILHGR